MLRGGLLAACGAVLGSTLRYLVGQALPHDASCAMPWGTLAVNLSGALVIGVLAAQPRVMGSDMLRHFAITGVLGGFTTYSAFAVDAVRLAANPPVLAAYIALTFAGGVAAVAVGWRASAR